jgi:hypothetical protein
MNGTLLRALVALLPVSALLAVAVIMFSRRRTLSSCLQLIGAACLMTVVVTHVCEASELFPSMHWGEAQSIGHYVDLASAVLGLTLLPFGYLLRYRGAGAR